MLGNVLDEREFIYLIGRVGSGKSSLLKTIYGELDIDSEDAEKAVVLIIVACPTPSAPLLACIPS